MQKTVFNDDVHLQPVSGRFRNEKKNLKILLLSLAPLLKECVPFLKSALSSCHKG